MRAKTIADPAGDRPRQNFRSCRPRRRGTAAARERETDPGQGQRDELSDFIAFGASDHPLMAAARISDVPMITLPARIAVAHIAILEDSL